MSLEDSIDTQLDLKGTVSIRLKRVNGMQITKNEKRIKKAEILATRDIASNYQESIIKAYMHINETSKSASQHLLLFPSPSRLYSDTSHLLDSLSRLDSPKDISGLGFPSSQYPAIIARAAEEDIDGNIVRTEYGSKIHKEWNDLKDMYLREIVDPNP